MLIPNTSGISPLRPIQTRPTGGEHTVAVPQTKFDRVELSTTQMSSDQRFAHELGSRIAQEVRTHRSPEVQQLKEQVSAGTYQWDVSELATRIMLYGGDV